MTVELEPVKHAYAVAVGVNFFVHFCLVVYIFNYFISILLKYLGVYNYALKLIFFHKLECVEKCVMQNGKEEDGWKGPLAWNSSH